MIRHLIIPAAALAMLIGPAHAADLAAAHAICEQHRGLHHARLPPGSGQAAPDAPYEPAFMSECMAVNDALRAQSGAEIRSKTNSDLDALRAVAPQ